MKKTTLAVLTIASAASVAGIASAIPIGPGNLPQAGGLSTSELARGGGGGSNVSTGGQSIGPGVTQTFSPIVSTNTPVVGVPEGVTSLLLLGAGFVVLALWRRRWQHSY
jgi:hypothetical protein